MEHIPVLLKESIDALKIKEDGRYFDGTFGRGGHSKEILKNLGDAGVLFATDQDPSAVASAKKISDSRFFFGKGRFSEFLEIFPEIENNSLDGILLDLGVSSVQLDEAERGFSFMREGELDMRMNPEIGITAKEFVNTAEFGKLVNVIASYGEERFAKRIANRIIKERLNCEITTTTMLAEIVKLAVPAKFHIVGRHPATRTFQAIRIYVNNELGELEQVLINAFKALKKNGRLVIISFHSLEDSLVKKFVKKKTNTDFPKEIPITDLSILKEMSFVGRPIRPQEKEINNNNRARSSIMRIVEKL